MTRSGAAAIEWAKQHTSYGVGICLIFVRSAFDVAARYPSAANAWSNAEHKHPCGPDSVPAGVPAFFTGGSKGYGHIVVSLGNGLCRSTDWPRAGSVATARIADIERVWGLHFVGWSEDLNGVRVYTPQHHDPAPAPEHTVLVGGEHRGPLHKGDTSKDVEFLQRFLGVKPESGYYGDRTEAAVARYKQAHDIGSYGARCGLRMWREIAKAF